VPIVGLSDQRRLPRLIRVKLGVGPTGERGHPREVEYFDLRPDGGEPNPISDFAISLYGPKPRSLRIMLHAPVEAVDPITGDEQVFNLNMRAYGKGHGLRCKGTGGNALNRGIAYTDDLKWAARIREFTGDPTILEEPALPNGMFRLTCLGSDCPKALKTVEVEEADGEGRMRKKSVRDPDKDRDAACGHKLLFRFLLLHPERDPSDPNYCLVVGGAELASTSTNSIKDIRSGIDLVRPFTEGRTHAVAFTLIRKPTVTHKGATTTHWTCAVIFNTAEVSKQGALPVSRVFLTDAAREEVKRLRELGAAAEFETFQDLVPRFAHPDQLPAHVEPPAPSTPPPTGAGADVDEAEIAATAAAQATVAPEPPAEPIDNPDRWLEQYERDKLKAQLAEILWPDRPFDEVRRDAATRLIGLIKEYDELHGVATRGPKGVLDGLTVRHMLWLRSRITSLGDSAGIAGATTGSEQGVQHGEYIPVNPVGAVDEETERLVAPGRAGAADAGQEHFPL